MLKRDNGHVIKMALEFGAEGQRKKGLKNDADDLYTGDALSITEDCWY